MTCDGSVDLVALEQAAEASVEHGKAVVLGDPKKKHVVHRAEAVD